MKLATWDRNRLTAKAGILSRFVLQVNARISAWERNDGYSRLEILNGAVGNAVLCHPRSVPLPLARVRIGQYEQEQLRQPNHSAPNRLQRHRIRFFESWCCPILRRKEVLAETAGFG